MTNVLVLEPCGVCGGTGSVLLAAHRQNNVAFSAAAACSECRGTGRVLTYKRVRRDELKRQAR